MMPIPKTEDRGNPVLSIRIFNTHILRKGMDIVKEIKDILALLNQHAKDRGLERMNDVFEYGYGYDLEEEDIVEGVRLLLAAALREQDPVIKQRILRTIFKAVVYRPAKSMISGIDWDSLAASFSSLDKWQLAYSIVILGLTGQKRYIPILEPYTLHTDPDIRERAIDAIKKINSMTAHTPDKKEE